MDNFTLSKIEKCREMLSDISDYIIDKQGEEKEEKTFYVLENDYASDFDCGHQILGVYTSHVEAIAEFKACLEEEKEYAKERMFDTEEYDDLCYEAYCDGDWMNNHTILKMTCVKM